MSLYLRFKNGATRFEGREAEKVASIVISKVNRYGGAKKTIDSAVSEIEQRGGSKGFLDSLTTIGATYTRPAPTRRGWRARQHQEALDYGLFGLPREYALALEMALHEEAERRALEGELTELECAWREAEEIAGIADSLFLPTGVDDAFKKIKGG